MKLYAMTIRPLSGFGTSLKGDTIFGQFCWEVSQDPDLVNHNLAECLKSYDDQPFVVFSSAYPVASALDADRLYALKRPDIPSSCLWKDDDAPTYDKVAMRKDRKSRKWMLADNKLAVSLEGDKYLSDSALADKIAGLASSSRKQSYDYHEGNALFRNVSQPHNTINRITNTTGKGAFAPYSANMTFFVENLSLVIFALVDTNCTDIERIMDGIGRIGKFGFGRDASIGAGKFLITGHTEIKRPSSPGSNALYCLSPCVPRKASYAEAFFLPFVRFGKHGNVLAQSSGPFKNPVIFADEGAVFIPSSPSDMTKGYFGSSIRKLSKAMPETVCQGYSITIPFELEAPV